MGKPPGEHKFNYPPALITIAKCTEEKGIDIGDYLKSLRTVEDDKKMEDYGYCLFKTSGCIDEDGNLNLKVLNEYFEAIYNGKADLVMNTCVKTNPNTMQKPYTMMKCISGLHLLD